MYILWTIFLTLLIILIIRYVNKHSPQAIFGIYQQPNKNFFFKFIFMFIVLTSKQLFYRYWRRREVRKGRSNDGTIQVYEADAALEKIYDLGVFPKAVDAVYFNATSKTGAVVTCNVARRQNGVCNAFFYLKVEGGELLLSPDLPDSTLQQSKEELGQYKVAGISITNQIPMRVWKINYNGKMKKRSDPSVLVPVQVDLTWSTRFNHFSSNTDISPISMACDIARESWNSEYFKLLKQHPQNHYEQMGELSGTATINGVTHKLQLECVRDHSFGEHREWKDFHRYAYHFIYLENGDRIAVGVLSKPLLYSSLTFGYVGNGTDGSVGAISCTTFKLHQHGERGTPPTDYGFQFKSGGKTYTVQVNVKDSDSFYIGKDRSAKFHELWAEYEVNGVKGWGCSEWYYRNLQ